MKTPRELLLDRHRTVNPKLDALREQVIRSVHEPATVHPEKSLRASVPNIVWMTFWHELVIPSRRVWAGLAGVWLVLLVVNVVQKESPPAELAQTSPSAPMLLAYYKQQKLLNELVGEYPMAVNAISPRGPVSGPRSEIMRPATI